MEGDEEVRRRKLEVILQLGVDREAISLFGQFLLWWLALLMRLDVRRRVHVPRPVSSSDRTSVPALNLSECGDAHHFGGSLQTDPSLPTNYVSSTVHLESRRNNSFIARMLLSYLEFGGLARNITDFTYVLAGEEEDELPERALCTARVVRWALNTLPMSSISLDTDADGVELQAMEPPKRADRDPGSLYFKMFVTDPLVVVTKSIVRSVQGLRNTHASSNPASPVNALLRRTPRSSDDQRASINGSATDPFEKAVNELVRILEEVRVPVRKNREDSSSDDSQTTAMVAASVPSHFVSGIAAMPPQSVDFGEQSILRTVTRHDIHRYFIASDCSLKTASVRLVESAVWRAVTFPIDTRTCRVELQAGQFFQQGIDLDGNPVFYFRNTCLGPWRKDEDAVIAAVLHRLETRLIELAKDNPHVQCTLIVMMGRPYRRKKAKNAEVSAAGGNTAKDLEEDTFEQDTAASTAVSTIQTSGGDESTNEDEVEDEDDDYDKILRLIQTNNPRVYRDEVWNTHTSKALIERLIGILLAHYPERLSKALVVVGYKNKRYLRSAVGGVLALTSVVSSSKTRDKVRFLNHYHDLHSYVDRSELITLVGGTQREDMQHYECR